MEYTKVKKVIQEAIEQITTSNSWYQEPVVVIDYHNWEANKFQDKREAVNYLEKYCNQGDWSNLPFNGVEDEEIVVIKYCAGYLKEKNPHLYREYKFFKKVNGVDIYRMKNLAFFEASVNLDVDI